MDVAAGRQDFRITQDVTTRHRGHVPAIERPDQAVHLVIDRQGGVQIGKFAQHWRVGHDAAVNQFGDGVAIDDLTARLGAGGQHVDAGLFALGIAEDVQALRDQFLLDLIKLGSELGDIAAIKVHRLGLIADDLFQPRQV